MSRNLRSGLDNMLPTGRDYPKIKFMCTLKKKIMQIIFFKWLDELDSSDKRLAFKIYIFKCKAEIQIKVQKIAEERRVFVRKIYLAQLKIPRRLAEILASDDVVSFLGRWLKVRLFSVEICSKSFYFIFRNSKKYKKFTWRWWNVAPL